MPTPATAKWAKPRSEDEFEDIAVDGLRIRWSDPHVVRNGRRGQRQHGVDIVGRPPWLTGGTAGAQCKNMETLNLADVISAVEQAKAFPGGLGEFLVVTSAERDGALQTAVREHYRSHPAPFDVQLLFWPDVTGDVSQDDALVAKYWKGFTGASQGPDRDAQLREHLVIIRAEAARISDHADQLNRGLVYGWHAQYVDLKFCPEALESSRTRVIAYTTHDPVFTGSLSSLCRAAAAADREVNRLLAQGGGRERLRELVLLILNQASHVVSGVDRLLKNG